MPHLTLCEERPRPDGTFVIEGRPIALTHSTNPSLVGRFLCAITDSAQDISPSQRAAAERALSEKSRAAEKLKGREKEAAVLKSLTDAIYRRTDAAPASAATDEAPPALAGSKRGRGDAADDDANVREEVSDNEDAPPPRGSVITLPVGSFFEALPTYHPDDPEGKESEYRTSWYIPGPAGAGKSVFAAGVIRKYQKIWPRNPVFGICKTRLADDKAYKDLKIHQVPVRILAKQEVSKEEGLKRQFGDKGCLVLFDDWDSFNKSTDREVVLSLISDILNLGRKMRISILVTSHQLSNYKETRAIISECEFVTLFPRDTIRRQFTYLLEKMGVDEKTASRMRKMGRAVTLHKFSPMFILSETTCELLTR